MLGVLMFLKFHKQSYPQKPWITQSTPRL